MKQVKTIQDAIVKLSLPANRDLEYQHLPAGTPPVKARMCVCVCLHMASTCCFCVCVYIYIYVDVGVASVACYGCLCQPHAIPPNQRTPTTATANVTNR